MFLGAVLANGNGGGKLASVGKATIVWFRRDLRLEDNPALARAIERGGPVVPVYIHDPEAEGEWAPGGASRWWQHHALEDLEHALRARGARLVVRRGETLGELRALLRETGADAVYWNRRYEPALTARDRVVKEALRGAGVGAESFCASLLHEPWTVATGEGRAYRVYTPFRRCVEARDWPAPVAVDLGELRAPAQWPRGVALAELGLLPRIAWDAGIRAAWQPTRAAVLQRLAAFTGGPIAHYKDARDIPADDGTSRLSPYLAWGQIGPREVVAAASRTEPGEGRQTFLNEILWREFAWHVLFHFPQTTNRPLQDKYAAFPWQDDAGLLDAWRRGRTGYPIVDAGMRQLWQTGWMHNRVRMIVGSLLVKHLLQSWLEGARWFWDTLVDADLASNTLGWQWAGGCGADAAPYFRVFNPTLQGEKFDPEGAYVRRFVPELARMPAKWIHQPWAAPADVRRAAGVVIGSDYPKPVIDHKAGRDRALAAFAQIKG